MDKDAVIEWEEQHHEELVDEFLELHWYDYMDFVVKKYVDFHADAHEVEREPEEVKDEQTIKT